MGVSRLVQSGDAIEPNEFEFTYTGNYNFKDGAGGIIEIEFLTSGTFTLLKSTPFKPFDLCLVGGGGINNSYAGGGGGYVENFYDVPIELNKAYPIVIGGSAGDTTGFGYTAKAGKQSTDNSVGGDGGSGGGPGSNSNAYWIGSASSTFTVRLTNAPNVGRGQGKTTRAFGTGKLFGGGGGGASGAGGSDGSDGVIEVGGDSSHKWRQYGGNGGGGQYNNDRSVSGAQKGTANTGGGAGGGTYNNATGGSGIVILRRRWSENIPVVDNNKNIKIQAHTFNY